LKWHIYDYEFPSISSRPTLTAPYTCHNHQIFQAGIYPESTRYTINSSLACDSIASNKSAQYVSHGKCLMFKHEVNAEPLAFIKA